MTYIILTLVNVVVFFSALYLGIYLAEKHETTTKKVNKGFKKLVTSNKANIISPSKLINKQRFNDKISENKI